MVRLKRSLLIMALVAVLSVGVGVGMTINAEEPIPPAGDLAASSQSEVLPAVVVPGGPGFVSQSSWSCRPTATNYQWAVSGGQALYNTGASLATFECPVSLPHGATINKVVWYYHDNSSTNDIWVYLTRRPLDGPSGVSIASVTSSGALSNYQYVEDTSILYPTVDLQSYNYSVGMWLPADANVKFLSYRIDYQYGVYLPATMKNSN